jgi:hypothetical protein
LHGAFRSAGCSRVPAQSRRGRLDETLTVTSQDEIGHLTTAFNRMVEQWRHKERMRETFGKYVDPRIVEGLIDRPTLAVYGPRYYGPRVYVGPRYRYYGWRRW